MLRSMLMIIIDDRNDFYNMSGYLITDNEILQLGEWKKPQASFPILAWVDVSGNAKSETMPCFDIFALKHRKSDPNLVIPEVWKS